MKKPLVMITSWPPKDCGIATFAEEAIQYGVKPYLNGRQVHVISHTDGKPQNKEQVHPILDPSQSYWWETLVDLVTKLDPWVVHYQHEFGLYSDNLSGVNRGFLNSLILLRNYATVVESHTIHINPEEKFRDFLKELVQYAKVVIVKEPLIRTRLEDWILAGKPGDYATPQNIGVIRHGAMTRLANKYDRKEVLNELGLSQLEGKNIVLLIGWIQKNKKWDYILKKWEYILNETERRGSNSKDWHLLAAGKLRDHENNQRIYANYKRLLKRLEEKGLATFYRFTPRKEKYYKVMSLADIVALPSIDETQSGTQARIIAMNKPYVALPIEGIGLQISESQGGLLAIDEVETLPDRLVDLMVNPKKRENLSKNSANYLEKRVGWPMVGRLYAYSYELANAAVNNGQRVIIKEGNPLFSGHF